MNQVVLLGNISSNIYFDRIMVNGKERPMLRLIIFSKSRKGETQVRHLRIMLWDELALLYYPYLKTGSEIIVKGSLVSRTRVTSLPSQNGKKPRTNKEIIYEIKAEQLLLLRKIDWMRGEEARGKSGLELSRSNNHLFVVGVLQEDPHFAWHQNEDANDRYALLLMKLEGEDKLLDGQQSFKDLRVVVLGSLAEMVYPYLSKGSEIAIDGHLQITTIGDSSKEQVEVTAKHILFIDNIKWDAGKMQSGKERFFRQDDDVPEIGKEKTG